MDLSPKELDERYKENDLMEKRYQETKWPSSCNGCPNNPDNYDDLSTDNKMPEIESMKKLTSDMFDSLIEFNDQYKKEMGGSDES